MSRPYGDENGSSLKWAKARGLRYSPNAHCLHWVSKGRCVYNCCGNKWQWMDHVSGWTKRGERVLLCQPYQLTDFQSLINVCKEFNLTASVSGRGWYGHGTVCIELRPLATLGA